MVNYPNYLAGSQDDINKRFVILSKGEIVSDGMSKIYIYNII